MTTAQVVETSGTGNSPIQDYAHLLIWNDSRAQTIYCFLMQARNQDFMWGGGGGANEAKVDQTTEIYFLLSIRL